MHRNVELVSTVIRLHWYLCIFHNLAGVHGASTLQGAWSMYTLPHALVSTTNLAEDETKHVVIFRGNDVHN